MLIPFLLEASWNVAVSRFAGELRHGEPNAISVHPEPRTMERARFTRRQARRAGGRCVFSAVPSLTRQHALPLPSHIPIPITTCPPHPLRVLSHTHFRPPTTRQGQHILSHASMPLTPAFPYTAPPSPSPLPFLHPSPSPDSSFRRESFDFFQDHNHKRPSGELQRLPRSS